MVVLGVGLHLAALMGCASPAAVDRAGIMPIEGTVVPITLQRGMPIVELNTQGRTLHMIVDLGGTDALALTSTALGDLEVGWTGRPRFVSDAFGSIRRSRRFILPAATLGGLELRNISGYEVHDGRLSIPGAAGEEPMQFDGYVGIDLLRAFNLLVDYPNDRLILVDHEAPPPVDVSTWPSLPFNFSRMGVTNRVGFDGRSMLAVWDTGANFTVIRADRLPPDMPRWRRGSEEAVTATRFTMAGHDFGPLDLVLLDFRRPNVDMILGTNFFESRAVWFDFSRSRLSIAP